MKVRHRWATSVLISVFCGSLLAGCAPGVQTASIASGTATTVTQKNVDWTPLLNAITKSEGATLYRLQSSVSIQNGSLKTSYTVYGTIQLPDTINMQVHENNFNIGMYQQGQVAYQEDNGTWIKMQPLQNLDAYQGYADVIEQAMKQGYKLDEMNQTYVMDEYCNVYRVTVPNGMAPLPAFLADAVGSSAKTLNDTASGVEYVFYVGQTSGYLRQVQTQSVNMVNNVGPMLTSTTTLFSAIDQPTVAQMQIPSTLVQQLERGAN
ncbi:hypothetical protein [Alicyclobacillus acidiphilus]|uniref:hypothetical protein n=1 Tax=Alicyclobacillus acidiphilus TaxID=182455 RepID=UPI0008303079|nr:hypothetical protein [Alicyclobacillus acidiphilus]